MFNQCLAQSPAALEDPTNEFDWEVVAMVAVGSSEPMGSAAGAWPLAAVCLRWRCGIRAVPPVGRKSTNIFAVDVGGRS